MKTNRFMMRILVAVSIASCLGTAGAAEPVMTVFPKGVVKLTEANGRVIELKTNFPLKEGSLMETSGGECSIRGSNCGFVAQDKAKFSFNSEGDKWVCNIHSGKVNYLLRSDSRVKFAHRDAVYECSKITPTKEGGSVEGSATVVNDTLVFTNTVGEAVFVPTIAGVVGPPIVVNAAGAGGVSATAIAVGAGAAAAVTGAALGLSSGHGAASPK